MSNVLGIDCSFYQDDNDTPQQIDFNKMKSNGASFVIIRAGQNTWVDPDFAYNWKKAKEAGLARGSYWFYDSRAKPEIQAELYYSQFKGDFGELPLFADFEESYGGVYKGVANWKIFTNKLKSLLIGTTAIVGIYTAYYYWLDNTSQASSEYFKDFPLWIAQYSSSPSLVPYPWTKDNWMFWQFTEKGDGLAFGAESLNIDVNYFNGDITKFNQTFKLGETLPPIINTDKHYNPYNGVDVYEIERYDSKCIVHIIDPTKARIFVTPGQFQTVSGALNKYGAQISVNGGGWPVDQSIYRSNEIWASDGKIIQSTAKDNRGYINVNKKNILSISENSKLLPDLYNAWGFDRILGKDGIFNSQIKELTTKDARTGSGITADNKLVILSCEGNDYYNKGLTFPEMWEVLKEFGSVIAGNNDGGSSSAVINKALSDTSLIKPSEGNEANVINHVLIFGNPITTENNGGKMFFKVNVTANKRKTPSMYETVTAPGFPAGTIIETTGTIKDTNPNSNAIFVKTSDGWYQPVYYQITTYMVEIPDPTLPEEPPVVFPADVKDLALGFGDTVIGTLNLSGVINNITLNGKVININ